MLKYEPSPESCGKPSSAQFAVDAPWENHRLHVAPKMETVPTTAPVLGSSCCVSTAQPNVFVYWRQMPNDSVHADVYAAHAL